MDVEDKQGFAIDIALAESYLGMKQQALKALNGLEDHSKSSDPTQKIAIAEISLALGLLQQAYETAKAASVQFESSGQLDSELRSLCIAAIAAKKLKNLSEHHNFSTKAVDITSQIQQTWSPQVSQIYFSRPDIQVLLREIPGTINPDRR